MALTEKSEKLLQTIREDLKIIGVNMKEFSRQVIEQGISDYPIYIAYRNQCGLGKPFARNDVSGLRWNYNASVLEEFISRNIIAEDKVDDFRSAYSDALEKVCIFLLTDEGGNIIFLPFEGL